MSEFSESLEAMGWYSVEESCTQIVCLDDKPGKIRAVVTLQGKEDLKVQKFKKLFTSIIGDDAFAIVRQFPGRPATHIVLSVKEKDFKLIFGCFLWCLQISRVIEKPIVSCNFKSH